jgi:hypothetical protein
MNPFWSRSVPLRPRLLAWAAAVFLLAWIAWYAHLYRGEREEERRNPPRDVATDGVHATREGVALVIPQKPDDGPLIERLKTEGTEVQQDLANGVFRADDPVENLLAKHTPRLQLADERLKIRMLFFAPEEWGSERKDRTRVVLVFVVDGKLVQAVTRARTRQGADRGLVFFKGGFLTVWGSDVHTPSFWRDWDAILDRYHPAMVLAHIAVAGCPVTRANASNPP